MRHRGDLGIDRQQRRTATPHPAVDRCRLRRSCRVPARGVHAGAGYRLRPHHSPLGITWTAVTAAVMFALARRQRPRWNARLGVCRGRHPRVGPVRQLRRHPSPRHEPRVRASGWHRRAVPLVRRDPPTTRQRAGPHVPRPPRPVVPADRGARGRNAFIPVHRPCCDCRTLPVRQFGRFEPRHSVGAVVGERYDDLVAIARLRRKPVAGAPRGAADEVAG